MIETCRAPPMTRLEPLLKSDKTTLSFEAIGDDKVRVNCSSWEDAKVILADEAKQVVAFGKSLVVTSRVPEHRPVPAGRCGLWPVTK